MDPVIKKFPCFQTSENSRVRNDLQPRAWREMVELVSGTSLQGFCKTRKGRASAAWGRQFDSNWGWSMSRPWVTMWWGLNADGGWHPTPSWLAFPFEKQLPVQAGVSSKMAGIWTPSQSQLLSPQPLAMAPTNCWLSDHSAFWPWATRSYLWRASREKDQQDEQEKKARSLWGIQLMAEVVY